MATDRPDAAELIEAVQEFLQDRALPALEGHAAFEARVAANLLAISRREIAEGPAQGRAEAEGLRRLLRRDGSPEELEAALVALVREGDLEGRWEELIAHLRRTAEGKLRIANPRYLEER
jgi:hypothetical protein